MSLYLICSECGRGECRGNACTYCGSARLRLTETPDELEPVIEYRLDGAA